MREYSYCNERGVERTLQAVQEERNLMYRKTRFHSEVVMSTRERTTERTA